MNVQRSSVDTISYQISSTISTTNTPITKVKFTRNKIVQDLFTDGVVNQSQYFMLLSLDDFIQKGIKLSLD